MMSQISGRPTAAQKIGSARTGICREGSSGLIHFSNVVMVSLVVFPFTIRTFHPSVFKEFHFFRLVYFCGPQLTLTPEYLTELQLTVGFGILNADNLPMTVKLIRGMFPPPSKWPEKSSSVMAQHLMGFGFPLWRVMGGNQKLSNGQTCITSVEQSRH
jgi:hypothetical protein